MTARDHGNLVVGFSIALGVLVIFTPWLMSLL
jgi:hypothetical protein